MFAVLMTRRSVLLVLVVFTVFPLLPTFLFIFKSSDFNDLLNGCIPKLQYPELYSFTKKPIYFSRKCLLLGLSQ